MSSHTALLALVIAVAAPALLSSCARLSRNARDSSESRQSNSALVGGGVITLGIVRSTALSAITQPVTTTRLGLATLWHRPREAIAANIPIELAFRARPSETPGEPDFEALLDRHRMPGIEYGRLKWLVDGNRFFPELDRQIAGARNSIDLQTYIFDNDYIAVQYANALRKRAEDIPVRVIFDDLGSAYAHTTAPETPAPAGFVPPLDMKRYLGKNSPLRARRILNPWLVADHTKLMVFDDRTAFMGGMNIGREYFSEWHDLMVKVEGPVVASLAREFNQTWKKAGFHGDIALFDRTTAPKQDSVPDDGIPLRVLRTDPAEGRYEILETTLLAIRAARTRIWVENPYLAHDDITLALESAARRGVDVRVILPDEGNSPVMDAGNRSSARGLILAGAKVYLYPKMTHMKVLICDGWATVGSANLDTLSVRINRELNLAFNDPATLRELERQVFTPDFSISRPMKLEDTRWLLAPLAEALADQL